MIQTYLITILRNFRKHSTISLIHLTGLVLGISSTLIVVLYADHEFSFDQHHAKSDKIYRLQHDFYADGLLQYQRAKVFPELGIRLKQSFNEIENSVRIFPIASEFEPVFSFHNHNGKTHSFSEESVFMADSTLTQIFDLNFIQGDNTNSLNGSNQMIISKSTAERYFQGINPVGIIVNWKGYGSYEITGVFDDLPATSHFHFEIVVSWFNTYGPRSLLRWDGFYTYLLINNQADINKLNKDIQDYSDEYLSPQQEGKSIRSEIQLQPLESIHLYSNLTDEFQKNGDYRVIYGLIILASLLLLMAVLNYINLSTARASDRFKEIAIRKVSGSSRSQLIMLFLFESLILIIISFILANTIIQLTLPALNSWLEIKISFDYWEESWFWLITILSIFLLTILSGLYPAFILSGFSPAKIFKPITHKSNKVFLRNILSTFQFTMAIMVMIFTVAITFQLQLLKDTDLGFNADKVMVIKSLSNYKEEIDSSFQHKFDVLKSNLIDHSLVEAVSVSSHVPGESNSFVGELINPKTRKAVSVINHRVDSDFRDVYKIPLLAGNFVTNLPNNNGLVINEKAAKALGFTNIEDAIGYSMPMGRTYRDIIGIIENYHHVSPQSPIKPALYSTTMGHNKYISVRLRSNSDQNMIETIKFHWISTFPDRPFEYFFMDEHYGKQYASDEKLSYSIYLLSGIAMLIAMLGLIGLTSYHALTKTKEIGIRKVLGAKLYQLNKLLVIGNLRIILISAILASPVAYFLTTTWLENYSLKIDVNIFHFLIPILSIIGLSTLITVQQTWKTTIKNPVETLKHE